MDGEGGGLPPAMPVPSKLENFLLGRALTPSETDQLTTAGVPLK
jgi:hypothetical protein